MIQQTSGPEIAYFSMEIALAPAIPTYSGGLGILAGDTIRSAADLGVPMVAVSLVHHQGYFSQSLDASGWQQEAPTKWDVRKHCHEKPDRVAVSIENRRVAVRAWQYDVKGVGDQIVPVFLLDTDLPENTEWDRQLTGHLYGGDNYYRLCQEVVLGIGGVRMLRAVGYDKIVRFHMNEGHAALLGLELLDESSAAGSRATFGDEDIRKVRQQCVFTTHTPVPAGHDQFPLDIAKQVLNRTDIFENHEVFCCAGELNLTYLALNLSRYVNGVAKRHGEVSRQILVPRDENHHYQIDHITNGVDLKTWASPSFAALFDRHVPGWREDNASLRGALAIPDTAVWDAHQAAKQELIDLVNARTHASFDTEILTLGFARRATAYKRASLVFHDKERLRKAAREEGRLQLVFAGKAHPHDTDGKHIIQEITGLQAELMPEVGTVFLQDYDWQMARLIVGGVDVWLNTPLPPMEASGTSGMKAALNGVPSLSVLDGWWIEGCIEGTTGWAIGEDRMSSADRSAADAQSLYQKLERTVIPLYYCDRKGWQRIMKQAIALNASHFNTQRMVQQYVLKAYFG